MHNTTSFDKIEKYFSGDLSPIEKNALEREAAENPFLQDALDGYEFQKSGINYYKTNLKNKFLRKKYISYSILSIIALVVLFFGYTFFNKVGLTPDITKVKTNQQNKRVKKPQITEQIEVIPLGIDTLVLIEKSQEIRANNIVEDFKNNPDFNTELVTKIDSVKNDHTIIEIADLNIEEEIEEIDLAKHKKKIYPFKYFYNMAVVDYTHFENRTQTIQKTTYLFSGVDASLESEHSNNQTQFTEKVVKVSYMDYLKESMYYFSKGKYKNALKRFDVIASQYKNDYNALFYGGLSNYNLKRFNFALLNFTTIIDQGESPFYDEALWYRAKTNIKLGQTTSAKTDLEMVIINNGFYTDKAIALLKSLN